MALPPAASTGIYFACAMIICAVALYVQILYKNKMTRSSFFAPAPLVNKSKNNEVSAKVSDGDGAVVGVSEETANTIVHDIEKGSTNEATVMPHVEPLTPKTPKKGEPNLKTVKISAQPTVAVKDTDSDD